MPPEVNLNTAGTRTMAGRPYIRLTNVSTPTITLYKPKAKNTGVGILVFPGGGYQTPLDGSGGDGGLRMAKPDRRDVRAAEVSRPRQRTVSQVRGRLAGCAARNGAGARARSRMGHRSAQGGRAGILSRSASCRSRQQPSTTSGSTTRSTQPISWAAGPTLRWCSIPATWQWQTRTLRRIPMFIRLPIRLRLSFCRRKTTTRRTWKTAVVYFMELKNAKVPAELHIYAQGGHGFGLRPRDLPIMGWPKLVGTWLHTIKALPAE